MSNHTTIHKGNIPLDQCGCLKVRFENTQDYKALINHNGTPTASVCGGKGEEVIATLKTLEGYIDKPFLPRRVTSNMVADKYLYFINKFGDIDSCFESSDIGLLIKEYCTEVPLKD